MKIIITFQLFSSFFLKKHATVSHICDKRRKQPKKLSEITEKVYNLGRDIEKYCTFVDIDALKLLYGLDHVGKVCGKVMCI